MISALSPASALRIVAARRQAPFTDVADLKRRADLDAMALNALAAADALRALAGHRREAFWDAIGTDRDAMLFAAPPEATAATLIAPTEAQDILQDYRSTGLTLRRHPLALLRPQLSKKRAVTAAQLMQAGSGKWLRTIGIVTCRQRPSTASGTTFVTLEDETGYVNVVVWPSVAARQRKPLLFSRLLSVAGRVERQGAVVHLIAEKLIDETRLLGELATSSRDFH